MLRLLIKQPGQEERIVEVAGDEATIGRADDCEVPIDSRYVSKPHAKVRCCTVITDLNSTNGVWVDGKRLKRSAILEEGVAHLGSDPDSRIEIVVLESPMGDGSAEELRRVQAENESLHRQLDELERAVWKLDTEQRAAPGGDGESTEQATMKMPPPAPSSDEPPVPASRPAGPAAAGIATFLRGLLGQDPLEARDVLDRSAGEVVLLETLRFVRRMETLAPSGSGKAYLELADRILSAGAEPAVREDLVEYLASLSERLGYR